MHIIFFYWKVVYYNNVKLSCSNSKCSVRKYNICSLGLNVVSKRLLFLTMVEVIMSFLVWLVLIVVCIALCFCLSSYISIKLHINSSRCLKIIRKLKVLLFHSVIGIFFIYPSDHHQYLGGVAYENWKRC